MKDIYSEYSMEKFEKCVSEGIDALPLPIIKKLSNVALVVEEEPTARQREYLDLKGKDPLLGLYEGIPQTERGSMYEELPDKITIFKRAILSQAKNEREIRDLVRTTVWHEVAHHFGMEEDEVRSREEMGERGHHGV
ncbi:MAG: metallopeptidase family protein [Patescibacteria group bacterium]